MDVVAPFNMIEAARKASGLMQRLDATAAKLDSAITRVDRVLLAGLLCSILTPSQHAERISGPGARAGTLEQRVTDETTQPTVTCAACSAKPPAAA